MRLCPPDTSKVKSGHSRSRASSSGAKRCPSRWFTPTKGTSHAYASAFALERPTSSDPIRPGPLVTATPSIAGARGIQVRLFEGPAHDGSDGRDVGTTRQLGHHSPKGAVLIDRGLDDRRVHPKLLVNHGRRRLVTTGFDTEDQRHPTSVGRWHLVEVGPQDEGVFADALVVVLANPHGTKSVARVERLGPFVGGRHFERGSRDAPLLGVGPGIVHE